MISVIIPVYNAEKYIIRCIDSVLCQEIEKEIICVDDGSTDSSKDIIEKYSNTSSAVKLFCQNHLGAPAARNFGLKMSKGDYCLFLDADDELIPNGLHKMLVLAENKNADLVIGNYTEIDENNNFLREVSAKTCLFEKHDRWSWIFTPPFPGNKLILKKLIVENNLFYEDVKIGQDLNFYLKIIALCKKPLFVDDSVCMYRIVAGSISRTYSLRILDICKSIDGVKCFYLQNGLEKVYQQYVSFVELIAYQTQLEKMIYFKKEDKKVIKNVLCPRVSKCRIPIKFWYRFLKKKIKIRLIVLRDYYLNRRS